MENAADELFNEASLNDPKLSVVSSKVGNRESFRKLLVIITVCKWLIEYIESACGATTEIIWKSCKTLFSKSLEKKLKLNCFKIC